MANISFEILKEGKFKQGSKQEQRFTMGQVFSISPPGPMDALYLTTSPYPPPACGSVRVYV